jgi:hypothetical protein
MPIKKMTALGKSNEGRPMTGEMEPPFYYIIEIPKKES